MAAISSATSPASAIIYESIHSGALNGSVDSDGAVNANAITIYLPAAAGVAGAPARAREASIYDLICLAVSSF